jgi:hypothetical protein
VATGYFYYAVDMLRLVVEGQAIGIDMGMTAGA